MATLVNRSMWQSPGSRLGRWAVGLGAAFVVMVLINTFVFMPFTGNAWWRHTLLPFYVITMMLCGLASGIAGLMAILQKHERSWLVWITLLPGAFVFIFLLSEFLFPH